VSVLPKSCLLCGSSPTGEHTGSYQEKDDQSIFTKVRYLASYVASVAHSLVCTKPRLHSLPHHRAVTVVSGCFDFFGRNIMGRKQERKRCSRPARPRETGRHLSWSGEAGRCYLECLRSSAGFRRLIALNTAVNNAQFKTRPIWIETMVAVRMAVTSNMIRT